MHNDELAIVKSQLDVIYNYNYGGNSHTCWFITILGVALLVY